MCSMMGFNVITWSHYPKKEQYQGNPKEKDKLCTSNSLLCSRSGLNPTILHFLSFFLTNDHCCPSDNVRRMRFNVNHSSTFHEKATQTRESLFALFAIRQSAARASMLITHTHSFPKEENQGQLKQKGSTPYLEVWIMEISYVRGRYWVPVFSSSAPMVDAMVDKPLWARKRQTQYLQDHSTTLNWKIVRIYILCSNKLNK